MKHCVVVLSLLCSQFTHAQVCDTLVLQMGSDIGQDALLHGLSSEVNVNYGSNPQIPANAWTFLGNPGNVRSVLEFPLGSIPQGSIVSSASLELFAWGQSTGMGPHSQLSGSNDFYVMRVTSPWNESTVTWNTQPSTITQNELLVAGTNNPTLDYNINVTTLVQDMVNDPMNSHGFMLQLVTEAYYRRMNFCSRDHSNPAKHPRLTVIYCPPLGVENFSKVDPVNLFPNPAENNFSVTGLPLACTVTISDALGRVIMQRKHKSSDGSEKFNIDLAPGFYFVQVEAAGLTSRKKLIVSR